MYRRRSLGSAWLRRRSYGHAVLLLRETTALYTKSGLPVVCLLPHVYSPILSGSHGSLSRKRIVPRRLSQTFFQIWQADAVAVALLLLTICHLVFHSKLRLPAACRGCCCLQ